MLRLFLLVAAMAAVAPTVHAEQPRASRPDAWNPCNVVSPDARIDYETLTPVDAELLHIHLLSVDPSGADKGRVKAWATTCPKSPSGPTTNTKGKK